MVYFIPYLITYSYIIKLLLESHDWKHETIR
jgi:hypothetical protein